MKKISTVWLMLVFSALVSCGVPSSEVDSLDGEIVIEGSSTLFPISEAVAEEFRILHPNVEITIGGTGSSNGMKALCGTADQSILPTADIGNSSRAIKSSETAACEANGVSYEEFMIGYDGITVVVNKANTWLTDITQEELKTLWQDTAITRWNELRAEWPNQDVVLYGPGEASGTFDYFREVILGSATAPIRSDFSASEDDNILVTGVAGDLYSLGFFGFAYYLENTDKLNAVAVQKTGTEVAVAPTIETIADGSYSPLARPLYMYVNQNSLSEIHILSFLEFFFGSIGRNLIAEVGYVKLTDAEYEDLLSRLA